MNIYKWIDKNTFSLKGKTIAISGATGGIGVWVCDYLAYLGANIICLDRNAEKSNKLINNLKVKYQSLNAKHITLNLENINQVKSVADALKQEDIDYLILNAGAYKIPRHKCSTGFDNVFQINFVSPYYLANELAPHIKQKGGKVVAVSSIAHNYSKIDENDIDFSLHNASSLVYGNAKRFLTASLFELFKGQKTLSIVHPGITLTNITAHYPKWLFAIIKYPMKIVFMPPKKAALCIIYGVFNDCNYYNWASPRIFNIWGLPKIKSLSTITKNESLKIFCITKKIFNKKDM